MTRFSVIIAAFNQRDRLLYAVESVMKQSVAAHEVIVVDDGGTDGSAEAVRTAFPAVRVVTQENRGKGAARNHGAYLATGDWVCFLDHDDLWHPGKLEILSEEVRREPEVVGIDHAIWVFSENKDHPETAWALRVDFVATTHDEAVAEMNRLQTTKNDFSYLERYGRSYDQSLRRVFSTTSALSVRKDIFFRAGGFHPAHANSEDWALSVNVARFGEWRTLRQPLSAQRYLKGSDSSDDAAPLMALATLVNHWFGGRPLREHTQGCSFLDRLSGYSDGYRRLVQNTVWTYLRKLQLRAAMASIGMGLALLPSLRAKLLMMIPPQITWRVERYLLGMHKR
jgi:glycosyltransferase involved in cell wall biosynthesis